MTTIYLAGRYSRRDELRSVAHQLEANGIGRVRARWLHEDHEWDGAEDQLRLAARLAGDDVEDLQAADLVIVFTEQPAPGGRNRGGRHVEFGLALAEYLRSGPQRQRLVVCGPAENVFHSLVSRFASWYELLGQLIAELDPAEREVPADADRWAVAS